MLMVKLLLTQITYKHQFKSLAFIHRLHQHEFNIWIILLCKNNLTKIALMNMCI